jgi:SAM-dependent methyltransferase
MTFFSDANGFVEDDGLGYDEKNLARQNARYEKFILPIAKQLQGKRVLDLGAYDGRWAFACLHHGAAHVTAIEYRAEHIARAQQILQPYKLHPRQTMKLIQGDVFSAVPKLLAKGLRFDIILCLGMIQHVADHNALMQLMAAFKPELIVVDGVMIDSGDKFTILRKEPTASQEGAPPTWPHQHMAVTGLISRAGFKMIADTHRYAMRMLPWKKAELSSTFGITDYLWPNKIKAKSFSMHLTPRKNDDVETMETETMETETTETETTEAMDPMKPLLPEHSLPG